jgi:hypothetical protein
MKVIYMQRTFPLLNEKEWNKIKDQKNVKHFNDEVYVVIEE